MGSTNENDHFTTNKTGAGFGLTLTLNIEQYEYIRGPSTDAGIKVSRKLGVPIIPGPPIITNSVLNSPSFP